MAVNIGNQTSFYNLTNTSVHVLQQFSTVVSSAYGIGSGGFDGENLVVAGSIVADSNGIATGTSAGNMIVTIQSTGTVFGNDGAYLSGANFTLTNAGSITGWQSDGVVSFTSDDNLTLQNSGSIFGRLVGIDVESDLFNISNSGLVAGEVGIEIDQNGTVYNSGTISGEGVSVQGGDGNQVIFNSGIMEGSVVLDSGDDVYRASGDGLVLGNVRGGGGNDDLRGASAADELIGGNGNDKIKGREGEDTLEGGNGRDIIFGGDGDDQIKGGNAGDLMLGGAGADEFLFTDTGDIGTTSATRDEIRDFEQGVDIINLAAMVGPDFIFLGTGGFTGGAAPELRLAEVAGSTFVQLDYDGDGTQDGRMLVRGVVDMLETDFLL